jgi:biotin carboxylase
MAGYWGLPVKIFYDATIPRIFEGGGQGDLGEAAASEAGFPVVIGPSLVSGGVGLLRAASKDRLRLVISITVVS